MERLEAALEKARESRKSLANPDQVKKVEVVEEEHPVQEIWHKLKEIKISNLTARRNRITTLTQSKQSTHYDLMRTRTLRLLRENNWTSLAITSPNMACGKTTVSANLAISLARQPDLKILVLDMDFRRPALNKILGYRPAQNLHEVLEGKIRGEDQLVRFGENLAFGLNNQPARSPSELLQAKLTKTRLEHLRNTFQPDLVIYDMPPMLVSDDSLAFLPGVDCGLLISAADSTTMSQLDVCEKELSELTNVLGVVLNKCRYAIEDTGYDQDYY